MITDAALGIGFRFQMQKVISACAIRDLTLGPAVSGRGESKIGSRVKNPKAREPLRNLLDSISRWKGGFSFKTWRLLALDFLAREV